ncbi:MAG: folylpolyglutamate synthase/dihydrofolate synthase family protein [Verrucomicrobiales bacterium]
MTDSGSVASFSSYQEAIGWLYGTQQFGIKLGLENMARLLSAMHLPDANARVIHVAGTNGKGSVCAFSDSMLQASGYRSGLFTSPHLVHYGERMRINGLEISEPEIATRLSRLHELVAEWEQHPTFFELTLALALDWFRDDGVEVIVLETGMGGRLDATNAVPSTASVITPIAIDHQKWLGNDLASIAAEKAGILKPGVPAFSSRQPAEVAEVLQATADRIGAPLTFLSDLQLSEMAGVPLGLAGAHQRSNAALALAAVRAIGCAPESEAMHHGLNAVRWPARFERFLDGRIIIDGAHNVQAAEATVATWLLTYGTEKADIVFGSVEDKDQHAILKVLAPIAATIHYVPFASVRAIAPEQLAKVCHPDPDIPLTVAASLRDTITAAARSPHSRTLVVGSLFLAGESIAILHDEDFENSAQ